MQALEDWRRIRSGVSRAEFVSAHPHPFLVSGPRGSTDEVAPAFKAIEFRTVTHDRPAWSLAPEAIAQEQLVLALRKAASNPFPERISVGRAPNCDVVLREPSVSKLHGHFRDVRPDRAIFTDAKSANGTRLDGTPVEPGVPVEILRQCIVELGRVRLVLLSADDLYDWLQSNQSS